jgi:protein dithiol oxidoreductase (disulfide-forming)
MKSIGFVVPVALLACAFGAMAKDVAPKDPAPWIEGKDYFLIVPAQPTSLPKGKVEVTEVFSYGCPYCNSYLPILSKLKQALPANAVVDYLPASFNSGEDWPMFQRAYLTAQILGVADKAHEAMFDAVWKTGELAILDPSGQLKTHLPTIEDAGRFYNRVTGVSVADFVAAAKSMGVDTRVGQTENLLIKYRISGTPAFIVNGRYRVDGVPVAKADQLIEVVKWLVAKESGGR